MNYNNKSYSYILYHIDNGLFDKYIDMMYILTMENSTRRDNYINNIYKYKIHSNVIVQVNKGYKKIKKKLYKQTSIYDLNDSYYHVFLHAKKNNYKNILIFEDDFFLDRMIDNDTVNRIGNFISCNKYHVYNICSALHLSIPYSLYHHKSLFYFASHGAIYSKLFVDKYIKDYKNITVAYDEYWNNIFIIKYKYYKPLCFQLFVETENRKKWPFANFAIIMVKLLKMDETHKPGFTILTILPYILLIILILLILILIL